MTVCKAAALSDGAAQEIGTWFDKELLPDYIRESISKGDYDVLPGFKKQGDDQGANYDCDLIVFEFQRQKIFFIQAKWKRYARTANLDDEFYLNGMTRIALSRKGFRK